MMLEMSIRMLSEKERNKPQECIVHVRLDDYQKDPRDRQHDYYEGLIVQKLRTRPFGFSYHISEGAQGVLYGTIANHDKELVTLYSTFVKSENLKSCAGKLDVDVAHLEYEVIERKFEDGVS